MQKTFAGLLSLLAVSILPAGVAVSQEPSLRPLPMTTASFTSETFTAAPTDQAGRQRSRAWLDYERYDSPVRAWFRDILGRGIGAIVSYRDRKREGQGSALTQEQVNRVGYWLLGKKRLPEAIAVFEMNAEDSPASWNVHDSLAEAYAEDGQKQRAIAAYEKSLALNPGNANGAEQLRKLRGEEKPK